MRFTKNPPRRGGAVLFLWIVTYSHTNRTPSGKENPDETDVFVYLHRYEGKCTPRSYWCQVCYDIVVDKPFSVAVGTFEGPFDLLLTLIEERKMHISDISLAAIADDFVQHLSSFTAFPAGEAAQFIVTAATLILIKSRSLLPVFSLSHEEEADVHDLERRLALYQVYRKIARTLGSQPGRIFWGGLSKNREPVFAPAPDLSPKNLANALRGVLAHAPTTAPLPEARVQPVISLEEMMTRLGGRIQEALAVTFRDFVGNPEDKREIIVGFLAVLELVKRGTLLAEQGDRYGDIQLHYQGTSAAPKYTERYESRS